MGSGIASGVDPFDVCIVGGGVIGCAVLRALLLIKPELRVCLIEKEADLAVHQSGRNSGVVHVGYNQKPGTLKAQLVVEGSRQLRAFCRQYNVPLVEDGILVVARNEKEVETLQTLLQRGEANGAQVQLIDGKDIACYEPEAVGKAALWAPEGASFDSRTFVHTLARQAQALGAQIFLSEPLIQAEEEGSHVNVQTNNRRLRSRVFVNAGGLHADRLAAFFGAGSNYRIVPFRGYYWELVETKRHLVRSHIYPCPDLQFPFLGVHLSRQFDGRALIGPGAALALGREAYHPFGFHPKDCADLLNYRGFWRLCASPTFRSLVRQEWKKSLSRSAVVREARQLVPALQATDLMPARSGIRAQLVSREGQLVEDLVVESTPRSVHILNAVSPALTCSLPFAEMIAEQVLAKV